MCKYYPTQAMDHPSVGFLQDSDRHGGLRRRHVYASYHHQLLLNLLTLRFTDFVKVVIPVVLEIKTEDDRAKAVEDVTAFVEVSHLIPECIV